MIIGITSFVLESLISWYLCISNECCIKKSLRCCCFSLDRIWLSFFLKKALTCFDSLKFPIITLFGGLDCIRQLFFKTLLNYCFPASSVSSKSVKFNVEIKETVFHELTISTYARTAHAIEGAIEAPLQFVLWVSKYIL